MPFLFYLDITKVGGALQKGYVYCCKSYVYCCMAMYIVAKAMFFDDLGQKMANKITEAVFFTAI
ncbi:MAG: hypothetical protein EAZ67_11995 [Cytophagales bacterium]|nr:MAG: hypothetical protein EAZ67_11995 [Cytophagales bacterium]